MKEIATDFANFVNAVFWHWQGWLGGSGFGGAIVVACYVYQELTGRSMSKRVYITVFIVAFLFAAFFAAWRDQYHSALAANAKLKESEPRLAMSTDMIVVGTTKDNQAILTITALIANHGGPSIATNFSATAILLDGRKAIGTIIPPIIGTITLLGNKPDKGGGVTLQAKDYLPNVALHNPIPTGGAAAGWMMWTFPGVTKNDLGVAGVKVELLCKDVDGRTISSTLTMRGIDNPPFDIRRLGSFGS